MLGRSLTILAMVGSFSLGSIGCTTKSDVKEEWRDVEVERKEAERTTEKYAEKQKSEYEDDVAKRLDRIEGRLATIRADSVQATGETKEKIDNGVWDAERQITSIREDFAVLKKADARSWDDDKAALDKKLKEVESTIESNENLTH